MSDTTAECHACTHTVPVGLLCPCPGAVCISCCQTVHRDDR